MVNKDVYYRGIRARLPRVLDRIAAAAERSGRDPAGVRIVAVTKGHAACAVEAVVEAGLRDIGENRVDELRRKRAVLNDLAVNWHMIGHVQRRKAGPAARLAGLVHSVDSLRLAEKLSRLGEAEGRRVPVLVQLNVSGEATKGGFPEAEALDGVGAVAALRGLRVLGLMTMAPFVADEAVLRSTFRKTRQVMEAAAGTPGVEGCELSMGMSNDYEIAVEEGSTMVRLGTTLLGARPG
ncbi:MAG: YggS family pyridoxal phosphate-dependent enzyme [Gemmatimonadetes bacterium]|nr:YggS family pyridoxal phosphate-dependent enzyme [Gemmatimonadota bacterium]MYA41367.1 YggS family pyridoxal phosphate-dependent enzyme [Gemmatimonadota bacterium]MYE92306.1 YggS family pyridoxal phosphate-dependent enzyme [Gemmatimonadota bacterium]MYJ10607.1 YggS family pyridoxal phosphate-dependent enzyme [Gemmatimonadota bacterium]